MWVTTKTFKVEAIRGSGGFSVVFSLLKHRRCLWYGSEKIGLSSAVSLQHPPFPVFILAALLKKKMLSSLFYRRNWHSYDLLLIMTRSLALGAFCH